MLTIPNAVLDSIRANLQKLYILNYMLFSYIFFPSIESFLLSFLKCSNLSYEKRNETFTQ